MAPKLQQRHRSHGVAKPLLKIHTVGKPKSLASWPKKTKLPKFGEMDSDGMITEYEVDLQAMPPMNLRVRPYATKDTGRCTSPLLEKSFKIKYFGSLRCFPATHRASPALTQRNSGDAVNQIRFSPRYRRALRRVGKDINCHRMLSPSFGEWLYGLPQGWTNLEKMQQVSAPRNRQYTVFDMFSGCAGLGLALHSAFKTVGYCEWDEACQKILKARIADGHLDRAPVFGDITQIKMKDIPDFDLAALGFPCQDISTGGEQAGFDGQRSVLFRAALTIIRAKKPKWVLVENVAALISGAMWKVWHEVLRSLQEAGYSVKWSTICAKHAGSPTTRERVFLLGEGKNVSETFPWSQIHEEVNFKKFNSPQPAMSQWLLADDKMTKRVPAQLKMLGNIVIPAQAKLALDVIGNLGPQS